MVKFNIFATVGTSEVDLAPYPGGDAKVPIGRNRNIYVCVFSNSASTTNTLTLKIYKDATLEASIPITLGAYDSIDIVSGDKPIIIVPSGRTLKAVASAESVTVLMTGEDE
ncbi:MAG: hypothetical protein QW521_02260 [Desulfurococcaceae archaeon]